MNERNMRLLRTLTADLDETHMTLHNGVSYRQSVIAEMVKVIDRVSHRDRGRYIASLIAELPPEKRTRIDRRKMRAKLRRGKIDFADYAKFINERLRVPQ